MGSGTSRSFVLGALVAGAVVVLSARAEAASNSGGTGAEIRFGTTFSVTRATPTLSLVDPAELSSRTIARGDLANAGGFRSVGAFSDFAFVVWPRLSIPVIGLGISLPVGEHAPIRSSVDGSIAEVQPFRMFAVDVLGPGIGVRSIVRRYFFEALVRTSLLYMGGKAQIAAGAELVDVPVHGVALGVRAELSACRRLDPESRVCLTLAPRLFEVVPASGLSVGLSWTWGR